PEQAAGGDARRTLAPGARVATLGVQRSRRLRAPGDRPRPSVDTFFSASRLLSAASRDSFARTYRTTSAGSVHACCRSAQPIAFWRKNSFDPSDGSMQA